jgi:hypothetical protein
MIEVDGRIGITRHASIYDLENSQKEMKRMMRLGS